MPTLFLLFGFACTTADDIGTCQPIYRVNTFETAKECSERLKVFADAQSKAGVYGTAVCVEIHLPAKDT